MTDLTLDALQKDVAQAICRERRSCHPHPCDTDVGGACFPHVCNGHNVYADEARAALAAVAKAAGGAYVLREVSTIRDDPRLRVAALLHVLAEAASDA